MDGQKLDWPTANNLRKRRLLRRGWSGKTYQRQGNERLKRFHPHRLGCISRARLLASSNLVPDVALAGPAQPHHAGFPVEKQHFPDDAWHRSSVA